MIRLAPQYTIQKWDVETCSSLAAEKLGVIFVVITRDTEEEEESLRAAILGSTLIPAYYMRRASGITETIDDKNCRHVIYDDGLVEVTEGGLEEKAVEFLNELLCVLIPD